MFAVVANPMGIAGGYGIIFYKKVNILKTTKGQLAKRFPLWREISKLRGIMNSSMFEYRKTDGCYPMAFFIKTFLIHPPTAYL